MERCLYRATTLSNHLRMHFIITLILVFAVCLGAKEIVSHINVCLWLTGRQAKSFSFSGSHELSCHFGKARQRRIIVSVDNNVLSKETPDSWSWRFREISGTFYPFISIHTQAFHVCIKSFCWK